MIDAETKIKPTAEFKDLSVEKALTLLSAEENGLSDSEAQRRATLYGRNEIVEQKTNPLLQFLRFYWGPMPWLLELAMALSLVLGHLIEAVMIIVLLTINAIIGFSEMRNSMKAVELLKHRLALKVRVRRDGRWIEMGPEEIVPGDVLDVKIGDLVPADLKIIRGNLLVDESALTGESLTKEKISADTVYSGSIVKTGEAKCLAINTGENTFFGRTYELVKTARAKSHQEEIMLAIVKYMLYLGLLASLIIAAYAWTIHTGLFLIITFVVIFLMGAVPVALPAVMTIVQAAAAMKMAKEGVLVTRLNSIEDAASITVLCLDKTGTITQNKLAVSASLPFYDFTEEDVARLAALASNEEGMDLIDLALLDYAQKKKLLQNSEKQISYTPFDPKNKRTEAVVETGGQRYRVAKGAVAIILSLCEKIDEKTLAAVNQTAADLSQKGYRTIAIARSADPKYPDALKFMGLVALADPLRPDSKRMIKKIQRLDIKPLMLTGDSLEIAQEIARQVGLGANILRFTDLDNLSEDEKAKKIEACDGFAEIYPEDKYKIVKLLQSKGHSVGMTGDGVNDAPALKQAEMGVAVSNAADVAKASASVVLTRPGVSVIIKAIQGSRETYQRMLTWIINKVTKVIQVVLLLAIGFFLLRTMVLSLLGMALLVFANDFVTMSLATDNVKFSPSPNTWNMRNITLASLVVGILLVAEGVIAVLAGQYLYHLNLPQLQTFVMLLLIFTSQFRVLIVRERRFFWSSRPGKALIASTALALLAFTWLGIYGLIITPISPAEVLAVLAFSAVFTLAIDVPKYYAFQKFGLAPNED